jgi:hypothetical protein
MKTLFIAILFMFTSLAYCQWVEHIIPQDQTAFPFNNTVKLSDLNGNGLLDIVYTTQTQGTYWRKNLGGGNFDPQELIIDPLASESARWFDTGDINNNGFIDIVVSYFTVDGGVFWYENLDGQANFGSGTPLQIPSGAISKNIKIADIDGDGKQDIVVSFSFQTQVARVMWFKNLGNGSFDSGTVIIEDADFVQEFQIGDIDGDGDLDVVIGSTTLNRLSWFENLDGQGTFSIPKPISDFNMAVQNLALGDINNNGFLDVVGSSSTIESLIWWENLDGNGNFSKERIILNGISNNNGFTIVDIDNDGDKDLFFVNLADLSWIENLDGLGNFGELQPIGNAAFFPNTIDVNEDGFIDVLLICSTPSHFCWYENRVLSTNSFTSFKATVIPNPAKEKVMVSTNHPIDKIELFTILGQKFVFEGSRSTEQIIHMEAFSTGLYFITVYSSSFKQTIKLIKE